MKLKPFFKLLNKKIKQYDKAATNPFGTMPLSTITLVWIEEPSYSKSNNKELQD